MGEQQHALTCIPLQRVYKHCISRRRKRQYVHTWADLGSVQDNMVKN